MNQLLNKVQLIGNLGADPEVRELQKGNKLCRMRIATNESYTNREGERVTNTTWHSVVAWGKQADLCGQLLAKGKMVAIEGKLNNRSYEDKKGVKHYTTEVVMNNFYLMNRA